MDDSRKKAEWAHMMIEALNDLDKAAKKVAGHIFADNTVYCAATLNAIHVAEDKIQE
jgi:hypothetical protein